jgi:polysaccharide pyruvyl transferase WcaK-like protein
MNILLLGYCGANNTGSEIRIITIVEDVQKAFPNANIAIASVNPNNTRKIIKETEQIKIIHLPFIFPLAVNKITKDYDLTLLVEGSTFKDNWSSALLYLFLWGAWCAKRHGNYCIPYAVDAGNMSKLNRFLTYKVANSMPLIITRTEQAKNLLKSIGVTTEIVATTDTAFLFEHN